MKMNPVFEAAHNAPEANINGLELSRKFFITYRESLLNDLGHYSDEVAIGLVGPGSECFGFDDHISRDHDWGPGLGIWVQPGAKASARKAAESAYSRLPTIFMGHQARTVSHWAVNRVGVMDLGEYLTWLIGVPRSPATLSEWIRAPEDGLACCVNGELFHDPTGIFSNFRTAIRDGLPEDLRRMRLASNCLHLGQAGLYNLPRSIRRGDTVATHITISDFFRRAMKVVYLLNRQYLPPYKWQHRGLLALPTFGTELHRHLSVLSAAPNLGREETSLIEYLCTQICLTLHSSGISQSSSDSLFDHGVELHAAITDPVLRSVDIWAEV